MSDLELDPRITTPLRSEWHPRALYLGLRKEFGAVDTQTLEEAASHLERAGTPQDLECAASALIEATIFSPNRSPDTIDTDIWVIDYAEHLLQEATTQHWQDLENGKYHPDDQCHAIRAETQLACIELYRDIICGEITRQTRGEVFNKLAHWGRYTHRLSNIAQVQQPKAVGLSTEIAVLLGGLTDEDGVLLPSTPREDSGETGDRSLTHDFNYLAFDRDGNIGLNASIELKRLEDLADRIAAEQRYDTDRIVVIHAHDLGIHDLSMRKIFNNLFDLTPSARLALRPVREGLYRHIAPTLQGREQSAPVAQNIPVEAETELPLAS